MQIPLQVYSRDGRLITEFGEFKRTPVAYAAIPQLLVNAVIAAEDDRFFEHPGVDYQGVIRAFLNEILRGDRGIGGSTITQQVARTHEPGSGASVAIALERVRAQVQGGHSRVADRARVHESRRSSSCT